MPQLWDANPNDTTVIRTLNPSITTISVPFSRFGLIKFGGRATITKLQGGGLVVFSPVGITPDVSTVVQGLGGNVSYLVAPDMEHHMQLGPWKKAYPSAKVIAMQGLREKRAKQNVEDVVIDYEFTKENKRTLMLPEEVTREFEVEFMDGHANKEIVLCHKPTKTLMEADVLFNVVPNSEQYSKTNESSTSGIFTQISTYVSMVGLGQQRFNWYALSQDRASFADSIKRINGWDFNTVIPCHGDVMEGNGKSVFTQIFQWHLQA